MDRNGQPIPGATHQTYQTTFYRVAPQIVNANGDGDHFIGCTVTGVNDLGSSSRNSSNVIHVVDDTPINERPPFVGVNLEDPGNPDPLKVLLVCEPGTWTDEYGQYQYQYQWMRNGSPIATTPRYQPVVDDYGRKLSCEVKNSNPAGPSTFPGESNTVQIRFPTGVNDIEFHREGGTNQVDPTNLLPITARYKDALKTEVIQKLNQGIDQAKTTCDGEKGRFRWPTNAPDPRTLHTPLTEEERCRIILYDRQRVVASVEGGVTYQALRACARGGGIRQCPSLGIQVSPIDPLKPPQEPNSVLTEQLARATPTKIVWDLDHNGTADATCAGSAPVMRTILQYHKNWHPRVVIVDEDGTVHTGDISFALVAPGDHPISGPHLRPDQVKVCGTSFDPPPSANLPCVTGRDIGPVQISNANLCPIAAREIQQADFEQLLGGDLKQYLLRVAEQQLIGQGQVTHTVRSDCGPAKTVYAGWDGPATPALDPRSGPSVLPPLKFGSLVLPRAEITAALANSAASVSSEDSSGTYPKLRLDPNLLAEGSIRDHINRLQFAYKTDQAPFAYDQIYVARGVTSRSGQAADAAAAGVAARSRVRSRGIRPTTDR